MAQTKIEELQAFAGNIKSVYEAIAKKIEELLILINEVSSSNDRHTLDLSLRIVRFLDSLRNSVEQEKKLAERLMTKENRHEFLALIQKELQKIKKLEAFLKLSEKRPTPQIIIKIHQLYQEIEKEMNAEIALLKQAA